MSQKHKIEKDFLTKKGTLWKFYCTKCFTGWKNSAGKTECKGDRSSNKKGGVKKERNPNIRNRSGRMKNRHLLGMVNAGVYTIVDGEIKDLRPKKSKKVVIS